ncbi:MAG: transcription-repair coupling factor [Oscillospiraceae bacterium]
MINASKFFTQPNLFLKFIENIKTQDKPIYLTGLSNIHKAHFINSCEASLNKQILVLCNDDTSAYKLSQDIIDLKSDYNCACFQSRDFSFLDLDGASKEYEQKRISTLGSIIDKSTNIVVSSIQGALQRTMPPVIFKKNTINIKVDDIFKTDDLAKKLLYAGYVKRDNVDGKHQFALRGGILDIFASNHEKPVRVEFWDDVVDSITYFDTETQRRTSRVDCIYITPSVEILVDGNKNIANELIAIMQKNNKNTKFTDITRGVIENLENNISLSCYDKYINLCYDEFSTIFDYFEDYIIILSEHNDVLNACDSFLKMHNQEIEECLTDGILVKELSCFIKDKSFLESLIYKQKTVLMDTFLRNSQIRLSEIIDINGINISGNIGSLETLKEDIVGYLHNNYSIVLYAGTEKSAINMAKDLQKEDIDAVYKEEITEIKPKIVYVTKGAISSGFMYRDVKKVIMTVPKNKNITDKKTKGKKNKNALSSLDDISYGDLLVHASHGIGRFEGIKNMDISGIKKDYVKIKYRGTDILYLPVTQLDLVSKYIGPKDNDRVKLNKLNSVEWVKTKQKVYASAKDMAKELITIYSKRLNEKGFQYSEDTPWQKEFEDHFSYTETDDQLRCIKEIKEDMEIPRPMDRLLCGDVGFGKTEVAVRAAFKAVIDGKQCAILVPTTILAWQHFQNITKRIDGFPIKIELLSRFRTPKQQKEIIKKLSTGEIDIIIGTHRIVQKDIIFKDLGLAVIDEEQRFGVTHKERFKEMFSTVDVLNLSATPIPRTLNMALSGIRDMSLIEEAPVDRQPVQTYVIEHEHEIVIEAIKKEKRRGGQCYYVYNNIEQIETVAHKIRGSIDDIKVQVAHGRMTEVQLSKIWQGVINGEIDVLVCTTIIETGVDISNCNTLIVENSDRMGLAQLYQLRGRVGRGARRAFCYLTFNKGKVLTEIATKRLSAIKEFTNFGSGFKIALRDLEIRGAGNLLGGSQHGHMDSVGYDMYIKLLNDAILVERGEKKETEEIDCTIDVPIDAFIPEDYIKDIGTRIDVYKKIAFVKNKNDVEDVLDELIDRFGDPPKCVSGLVDVALIRNMASQLYIHEINKKSDIVYFYSNNFNIDYISQFIKVYDKSKVIFNASQKPYVAVYLGRNQKLIDVLYNVVDIFNDILYKKNKDKE